MSLGFSSHAHASQAAVSVEPAGATTWGGFTSVIVDLGTLEGTVVAADRIARPTEDVPVPTKALLRVIARNMGILMTKKVTPTTLSCIRFAEQLGVVQTKPSII